MCLTLSLPIVSKLKIEEISYHMKALLISFHLNGHTLGFYPQTQKLEPHLLTQGLGLMLPVNDLWRNLPSHFNKFNVFSSLDDHVL